MENWKTIPGYENYKVSTMGRVMNNKGRVMKSRLRNTSIYAGQSLNIRKSKNIPKTLLIKKLMAITFLGSKEGDTIIIVDIKKPLQLSNIKIVDFHHRDYHKTRTDQEKIDALQRRIDKLKNNL